ncbi:MAG TPA: metal ABC transporter ATP-binding protein [Candidatus Eisenbacteria bacterium]|nr:metal ABC transporter ATP-binding protein [Candidatus Eisenbacteria bacterium]
MRGPVLLEIDDVTVQRDGRRLLSGVSLAVDHGSVHLLVGPNGAGKSTLFAAVLGRVDFTGSIRFHWRATADIGYVPQSFAVDRTLPVTVGEFLALSRQRRPVCFGIASALRSRIEELLERVGLPGFASRLLSGLSGGELQRVLLANAIDPVPEMLLLDEPASGLDETAVGQLERLLDDLKRSARTGILMVSHDLEQARRIADDVTLLDRSVRRTGPPDAVLTRDLAGAFASAAGIVEP